MFDFWNSLTDVASTSFGASVDTIVFAAIGIGIIGYVAFKIFSFFFGD